MQIRVEVEVSPEELRRFLGLPDVAGLQEDIISFLRDKVGAASDFDASGFVKSNLQAFKNSDAWSKIIAKVRVRDPKPAAKPAKTASRAAPKKRAARKPRKTAAPAPVPAPAPADQDSSGDS